MFGIGAGGWSGSVMYAGYAGVRVRPAASEAPVEPVRPVKQVTPAEQKPVVRTAPRGAGEQTGESVGMGIPLLREGADPVEMAVRGRIQYPGQAGADEAQEAYQLPGLGGKDGAQKPGEPETPDGLGQTGDSKSAQEVAEEGECQTCKERKYQDGSDDPGVSFKTPTHLSPDAAAAAVRGHENEHVVREQAKARREDRKVVSQSVTYHTAICPECGRVYVSGGTTRTTTMGNDQGAFEKASREYTNNMKMAS